MTLPALTPQPPYFAVIFTSVRNEDDNGYAETARQMLVLASEQPGLLGFESARQVIGISVSYWESLEAIAAWKKTWLIAGRRAGQESGIRHSVSESAESSANTVFEVSIAPVSKVRRHWASVGLTGRMKTGKDSFLKPCKKHKLRIRHPLYCPAAYFRIVRLYGHPACRPSS